jgi:hypothetical protein
MIRQKKKILRVGVLWDRTVEAIKAYQAEQKNDTDNLFITDIGTPINAHRIRCLQFPSLLQLDEHQA